MLVVSACVRDVDRARALAEGANAFLPKPCDLDEIVETLARLTAAGGPARRSPEGKGGK